MPNFYLADTLEQGASTLYSITSNLVGDGPVSKTLGEFFYSVTKISKGICNVNLSIHCFWFVFEGQKENVLIGQKNWPLQ